MDRNLNLPNSIRRCLMSLSARRAWIEMLISALWMAPSRVALRKESVDRNHAMQIVIVVMDSRSPQGERG